MEGGRCGLGDMRPATAFADSGEVRFVDAVDGCQAAVGPAFFATFADQTDVVLGEDGVVDGFAAVLAAFDASACLYSPSEGWWMSGGELG